MKIRFIILFIVLLILWPAWSDGAIIKRRIFSNFQPKQLTLGEHTQNTPTVHGGYATWLDSRLHDDEGKIMPMVYMKDLSRNEERPCMGFTNARKSGSRVQYRQKVAWSEVSDRLRPYNYDIRMYDYKKNETITVTKDKGRQDNPQLSSDFIIWKDWRHQQQFTNDPWDFAVYGMSVEGGDEFLIKSAEMQGTAELFGGYVVMATKSDRGDFDISLFVCSNKKLIPINNSPGDQYNPKIVGDVVVWLDTRNYPQIGEIMPTDIYGYNIITKKDVYISAKSSREYGLTVGGDRYVIWFEDSGNGFGGTLKSLIKGYDVVTGKQFNVTPNTGIYRNIVVDGHYVVWEDYSDDEQFGVDIRVFDILTSRTYCVVKGFGDQRNPKIYSDFVVWEDHNDNEEITVWGTSLANPSISESENYWGIWAKPTWQMFRGCSRHLGKLSIEPKPLKNYPIREQWKLDLGDAIYSSSCISSRGFAYVGCDDSSLYKISIMDGSIIWKFKASGRIRSSPALYSNRVFFGDQSGRFYCIDQENGNTIWQYQTPGSIEGSPTVFQSDVDHYGCVVFASNDKKLYAFNAISSTAIMRWSIELEGWSYSTPTVDYNSLIKTSDCETTGLVIYVGVSSNRLLCIQASNGLILSEYKTEASIESTPTCMNSLVMVGTKNGTYYCLDFTAYGIRPFQVYKKNTSHQIYSSPCFDPKRCRMYIEGEQGAIVAINDDQIWSTKVDENIKSSPALVSGKTSSYLFVGSESGFLVMIDTENGKVLWKEDLTGSIASSPALYNSGHLTVIVGTTDHKLYCYGQRPQQDDK